MTTEKTTEKTEEGTCSIHVDRAKRIKAHLGIIKEIMLESEDEEEIRMQTLCLIQEISAWANVQAIKMLMNKQGEYHDRKIS